MDMLDVYDEINKWIDLSDGQPIEIKKDIFFAFKRTGHYNVNSTKNLKLPKEYIDFLINVGSVQLFINVAGSGVGIEILPVDELKKFSDNVFDNFGESLFPEIILVGSIPLFGYFIGFNMDRIDEKNFGIFYADIPPEFWIEETDFISFNAWIRHLIETKFCEGFTLL